MASDGVLGTFDRVEPPRPVAAISFSDGEGRRLGLDDFPGGVVLNFWATWCGPCVREMPQLDRLKKHLAGDGIAVLALSEDREGAEVVKKFYRLNGIENLDVLIDGGGKVLRDSNIIGLPTTLLIDARRREVGRVMGVAEWESGEAIQFLRRCLGQ